MDFYAISASSKINGMKVFCENPKIVLSLHIILTSKMKVFLVIIGIIFLVILGIGILFIYLVVYGFKLAMREKYPLDYMRHIEWIVNIFEEYGFKQGDYINPGTDLPGIYLLKDNRNISLLLKADKFPYKIVCIDNNCNKILFEIKTKKESKFIAEVEESDKIRVRDIISHL